jgi:hypothetical protein
MIKLPYKNIKKNLDLCIILITGITGFLVFIFLNIKIELLIAILGFGISIAFSLRQSQIENDKMFKELFVMYNDKYDTKFNNCLNKIDEEVSKNPEYKLTEEQKPLIIDYLNLCAEEYLWHTKGRIDIVAWNSWERGMKYYLNINAIKLHIQNEKKQIDSYYGIFEYLKI